MAREDVKRLVEQVTGEQPLPTLYMRLAAEDARRFLVAYLLRIRANGFMVLLPDIEHVRSYVDEKVN